MSVSFTKRELLAAAALLILGAVLRFSALDRNSLWTDEFFTLRSIGALPAPGAPAEATPPLYFLLLKLWTRVCGVSAVSIRAFSAAWGVVGLLVVGLAAWRLFSPRAGLFALAITALSPFHLAYSQEARAYAMVFALSATCMYFGFRISDLGFAGKLGYVAVTAALLYTHYWGLFVWCATALFRLGLSIRDPKSEIRNSWPVMLAGASFLPHLPTLAATAGEHAAPAFWTAPPSLLNLGAAVMAFTGMRFEIGGWAFSLGMAAPLALGLLTALWTSGLLGEDERQTRLWLLCLIAGALLLPFLVSYRYPQMFVAGRYTMAAFPAAIWLAARGWSLWPRAGRAVSAAALGVLFTAGVFHYFTRYEKGNMKQAATFVDTIYSENAVLIVPAYLRPHWDFYYRGPLPAIAEAGMDEMMPELKRYQRAIFVTLDVPNVVKEAMGARYVLLADRRYPAAHHLGLVVAHYYLK